MSAFIVEDRCINGIVSHLTTTRSLNYLLKQIHEQTGANLTTQDGQSQLAKAMFDLNCNAVEQRYGKGEAAQFRPLNFEYRFMMPPSLMQAYKSLGCWLYQCSEGDVPDTSLLYATMKEIHAQMAHEIVRNLKAYETAKWD